MIALLVVADLVLIVLLTAQADASKSSSIPDVFRTLARSGLGPALAALERAAAADSAVLRDGHQLAHTLGRQAVGASGDAAVIRECRPTFASGCYHGVVEAFIQLRGNIDMAGLETMCSTAARGPQVDATHECIHGVGHGVLGATGMNVEQALRHCDELSRTNLRAGCHAGVFMESIGTAFRDSSAPTHHSHDRNHHTALPVDGLLTVLNPDNPYAPCERYDDPYAESCWLFQGFVILRRVNFDPAAAFKLCEGAPVHRVARCHVSIGHQLTGLFQRGDRWVIEQCSAARPEQQVRCANGAVLALVAMDWSGSRALRFCDAVPAGWASGCREGLIASLVGQGSNAEALADCAFKTGQVFGRCLRKAWTRSE